MGNTRSKGPVLFEGSPLDSPFPTQSVDEEKVGEIYLLVYKAAADSKFDKKLAHFSLLIDVAGQSDDDKLCGLEIHWVVLKPVAEPELRFSHAQKPRNRFLCTKKLGKLHQQEHCRTWWDLEKKIEPWVKEYEEKCGRIWNEECNSQTFSRFLVEKFGLEWPCEVCCGENCIPICIDEKDLANAEEF